MAKRNFRKELREQMEAFMGDKKRFSEEYRYYTENVRDNLFEGMSGQHRKMFDSGSGGELNDKKTPAKAKAFDSSSVLSYNFLSWINVNHWLTIDGVDYDKVYFEVKFPTLKSSNAPSNMDVVLISKDNKTALCIESKFTEYFEHSKETLSNSYLNENKYFADNALNSELNIIAKSYQCKADTYNYGIKQNICHLFGVSNFLKSETANKRFFKKYKKEYEIFAQVKNCIFMNLIFDPKGDAHELYEQYTSELKALQGNFPSGVKSLTNEHFIMNYGEMFTYVVNALGKDNLRCQYLQKRYLSLHHN